MPLPRDRRPLYAYLYGGVALQIITAIVALARGTWVLAGVFGITATLSYILLKQEERDEPTLNPLIPPEQD